MFYRVSHKYISIFQEVNLYLQTRKKKKKRNVNVRTYVLRNLVFQLRMIKENEVITSCWTHATARLNTEKSQIAVCQCQTLRSSLII